MATERLQLRLASAGTRRALTFTMTERSARERTDRRTIDAIADHVLMAYLDARAIYLVTRKTLTLLA